MPYLKGGTEYLDGREWLIYQAICDLTRRGKAANNSQLANATWCSRTTVSQVTAWLAGRGYLKDTGTGNAYRWRPTDKEPQREES